MSNTYKTVLTIAGSDSGGGAGIQADIKTISALGYHATTAITAITTQNTRIVKSVHPIPVRYVDDQLQVLFDDIKIDAIKIGMIYNPQVALVIYNQLKDLSIPIVLDPVMVSTTGQKLVQESTISRLRNKLCPISTIITPNRSEAEVLANRTIANKSDIEQTLTDLLSLGSKAVLIKGGHFSKSQINDYLGYYKGDKLQIDVFAHARIKTKNTHGTGCTLSSAIACYLIENKEVSVAVKKAIDYVHAAIIAGANYKLGKGSGPLYHFV